MGLHSINQEMYRKRIFLKIPFMNYFDFVPKHFFLNFELPNLGCGLSASAPCLLVFMILFLTKNNRKEQSSYTVYVQ